MSPTVEECLEHARQCEWYAARTNYEEDRRFLLWRAEQWTKRARELEASTSVQPAARSLGPSSPGKRNEAA
jgi:hypothetical protein